MNRKFKALGVALMAMALMAVMASAAQAQFFTSSASTTALHGEQVGSHVFTAGAGIGSISCSTATFTGHGTETSEPDQTIKPVYTGCKDSLGRTVHVDTSKATYTFTRTGTSGGTPVGVTHVIGGFTITVTGSTHCTIHIPAQEAKNGITYHNLGGTNGVEVTTETTNVTSNITGGFFACGTSASHSSTGTYKGTTLMKGTDVNNKVPAAISVD